MEKLEVTIRPTSMKGQVILEIRRSGENSHLASVSLQFPKDIAEFIKDAIDEKQSLKTEKTSDLPGYTVPDHVRFVMDMKKAGLGVRHYHGKFYYHGPATVCDNIQEVLSKTNVGCRWDNLGEGFIVYPVVSGREYGSEGVK